MVLTCIVASLSHNSKFSSMLKLLVATYTVYVIIMLIKNITNLVIGCILLLLYSESFVVLGFL